MDKKFGEYGSDSVVIESGGPLTPEIIEEAAAIAVAQGLKLSDRIASPAAFKMLDRIRAVEPGWDNWTLPMEIYLKAHELGITGL